LAGRAFWITERAEERGKRGKETPFSALSAGSVLSVIQILAPLEFAKILKCAPPRLDI
jgi:hypothetical protein